MDIYILIILVLTLVLLLGVDRRCLSLENQISILPPTKMEQGRPIPIWGNQHYANIIIIIIIIIIINNYLNNYVHKEWKYRVFLWKYSIYQS